MRKLWHSIRRNNICTSAFYQRISGGATLRQEGHPFTHTLSSPSMPSDSLILCTLRRQWRPSHRMLKLKLINLAAIYCLIRNDVPSKSPVSATTVVYRFSWSNAEDILRLLAAGSPQSLSHILKWWQTVLKNKALCKMHWTPNLPSTKLPRPVTPLVIE